MKLNENCLIQIIIEPFPGPVSDLLACSFKYDSHLFTHSKKYAYRCYNTVYFRNVFLGDSSRKLSKLSVICAICEGD